MHMPDVHTGQKGGVRTPGSGVMDGCELQYKEDIRGVHVFRLPKSHRTLEAQGLSWAVATQELLS